MKKINLLLVVFNLMLIFSACEKETYIKYDYYIENASNSEIYLSYNNKYNNDSIPFFKLEQNDYESFYAYYIIDENEVPSILDNMEFEFTLKHNDKFYTITKENIDGPTWARNYNRNTNLDYEGSTNLDYEGSIKKLHYNCESYVFTITDEFIATLTPNQ